MGTTIDAHSKTLGSSKLLQNGEKEHEIEQHRVVHKVEEEKARIMALNLIASDGFIPICIHNEA